MDKVVCSDFHLSNHLFTKLLLNEHGPNYLSYTVKRSRASH